MKKIISLIVALALVAPATSFAQATGSTAGATATSGSSSTSVNAGTLTGDVNAAGGAASAQVSSSPTQTSTLSASPSSASSISQVFEASKAPIYAPPPLQVSIPSAGIFTELDRPANAQGVLLENAFLGACSVGDLGPNDMAVQVVKSDFATVQWTSLPGLRTHTGGPYDTVVNFNPPNNDELRFDCVGMLTVVDKPGSDFAAAMAAAKDFVFKHLPKSLGRVYLMSVYEAISAPKGVATTGKGLGLSGSGDGLVGGATALLGLNAGIGSNKGSTLPVAQPGTTFVAVILAKDGEGVPMNRKILASLYHLDTPAPAAAPTAAAVSSTAAAPAASPATTATTH